MKFFILVSLIFHSVLFVACTAPYTTPTSQTQPTVPILIFGELVKEGEEAIDSIVETKEKNNSARRAG